MNNTQFVRGMAWHDIAKPLILKNVDHSRLGYLFLSAASYPEEALVALAHAGIAGASCPACDNLRHYFEQAGASSTLPPQLALSSILDRLAAASYSFMDKEPEGFQLASFQNPFSRLPLYSEVVCRVPELNRETFVLNEHERNKTFQTDFQEALNKAGLSGINVKEVCKAIKDSPSSFPLLSFLPDEFRRLLWRYQELFPERTYAPVNDTSLQSHTRFSAVLAFVVQRNLERAQHGFLEQRIWLDADGVPKIGAYTVRDYLDRGAPWDPNRRPFSQAQEIVRDHLEAFLVRFTLSGHEQLFQQAARVDDLIGIRRLAERVLQYFKQELATQLDVPDLAEYLWLSEGQFELFYLLPAGLTEKGIEQLVASAWNQAATNLVGSGSDSGLLKDLIDDFTPSGSAVPGVKFEDYSNELIRQLVQLGYGLRLVPVLLPVAEDVPADATYDFDFLANHYGRRLRDAYVESRQYTTSPTSSRDMIQQMAEETVADTCAVCGIFPVLEDFYQWVQSEEFPRKVTHDFRGQPEALCISCIARRILAHAEVSVPALEEGQMLTFDPDTGRISARWQKGLPDLPPALVRDAYCGHGDFVNLGAAYARRRKKESDKLQVFPTINYVADGDSNVALLSLVPTEKIYAPYEFKELAELAARRCRLPEPTDLDQTLNTHLDALRIKMLEVNEENVAAQAMVAEPHIARVLQRMKQVQAFYDALPAGLEQQGLRVLPLDKKYPALRLMFPAADLQTALQTLQEVLLRELLSIPAGIVPDQEMLRQMLPNLLHGALVIFKAKYPLYLALEAERQLFAELGRQPNDDWYGLRLGMTDLRRTLDERGHLAAQVSMRSLDCVLGLAEKADRHSLAAYAATRGRQEGQLGDNWANKLAEAQLYVRLTHTRQERMKPAEVDDLLQPEHLYPVHFITTVTKK